MEAISYGNAPGQAAAEADRGHARDGRLVVYGAGIEASHCRPGAIVTAAPWSCRRS